MPSLDLLPLFNALPGANLLLAPDLRIVAASDDYLAAILTERASIVGQFLFDAFPNNAHPPEAHAVANVRASLTQALATRQPHEMAPQHDDMPDPARPGQFVPRYWLLRHTPVLDAAGQVQYLIQSRQDITEGHRADQQLRESQAGAETARAEAELQRQRFYEVLMALPAQVATYYGPQHIYQFVNAAYRRYFPAQALPGRSLHEVLPEIEAQGVQAVLDRVYQTGEPSYLQELEVWLDFSGSGCPRQLFLNVLFHPLRDAQGRVDGLLDFSYDVTEQVLARRQVEQLNQALEARVQERTAQLSQQRQRLERLFMQVPAAMCMLAGPELVYELVNPFYQQLFPDRQLLGQPLLAALPELADHAAYHTIRRVFTTGESNWQHELHTLLARADGVLEDRYWRYVQQPRYDEQGGIDGVLIFGYEVTEQVEDRHRASALNAELSAANQQLTRTNVDLDNFIYTASHDLRVPIANIEGLLHLLRKHLPADVAQAPSVAAILTRMVTSVERFTRTIGHLTEVSKLREEHSPATEAISLAAVVEDVRLDLAPLFQAANAHLTVGVADFPPVLCSEKNLRSIIYNLLSNAVKYQHPDRRPHIDVQAHVSRGHTVLEVHDNGLGLGPAHLPKLFGMFQRFHPHIEGSGIGLYMVKRMVENAGGSIEVHSQLGAGTTFFVRLPHVIPTT